MGYKPNVMWTCEPCIDVVYAASRIDDILKKYGLSDTPEVKFEAPVGGDYWYAIFHTSNATSFTDTQQFKSYQKVSKFAADEKERCNYKGFTVKFTGHDGPPAEIIR